jgi:hypothetical protein
MTYTYGENSIGIREHTLCAPQILLSILVIVNRVKNFVQSTIPRKERQKRKNKRKEYKVNLKIEESSNSS